MSASTHSLAQTVGPVLLNRFPALSEVPGFQNLAGAAKGAIETGEWRIDADSGLRGITLHFDGSAVIGIACTYRDQREEFTFVTSDTTEEKVAPTLVVFLQLLLALPKDALVSNRRIRGLIDYHACTGIY